MDHTSTMAGKRNTKHWLFLLLTVVALALPACGDDDDDGDNGNGTLVEGPITYTGTLGGEVVSFFADGSRVRMSVFGTMRVDFPQGILTDRGFPGEVSTSVIDDARVSYTTRVTFPAIAEIERRTFAGDTTDDGLEAAIRFGVVNVEEAAATQTALDVTNFSWTQPTTAPNEVTRTVTVAGRLFEAELQLIQEE